MKKFLVALFLVFAALYNNLYAAKLLAEYHFEEPFWNGTTGEVKDSSGNNQNGKAIGTPFPSPGAALPAKPGSNGTCGYATMTGPLNGGGAFEIANLPVSKTAGAKTTVAFWMNWNGTDQMMPIGWYEHDLYLKNGHFGFNSNNDDIFGIDSAKLKNSWHHVVAIFTNGNLQADELYIDGLPEQIRQMQSTPNNTKAYVDTTMNVGGFRSQPYDYRFIGDIDEVCIYDGALTPDMANTLYNQPHSCQLPVSTPTPTTQKVKFDAWETKNNENVRNIYTKVASKDFTLNVGQFDPNTMKLLAPSKMMDINVSVSVVDADTNKSYSSAKTLSFKNNGSNPLPVTFNIPNAIKNAKIQITDSNASYYSSDSFAIKPSDFTLKPPTSDIKAGEPFDLNTSNPPSGYNGTADITTATYNQSCATKSGFLTTEPVSLDFASTSQKATGLIAKDVGDINVTIKDKTWTNIDQHDPEYDCVKDSSSNEYDGNGKVGCNIETNTTIKVIPYDIKASKTSEDPMWAYRSVNGDPKFNFSFDINATRAPIADLKEDKPQSALNFSHDCFAEDTNVTIDMGITPNTKSLTNVNDINITSSDSNVTVVPDKDKLTVKVPASLFNSGRANATLQINSNKNISISEDVVKLTATGWTSSINDKIIYDKLSTSDNIYFLYGKIATPNVMVDYASTATVRAYTEVYATDPATLPGEGTSKWIQAPGSSVWWINMLHDGSSGSIANAVIKNSTVLDSTTNATGFGFSANPPFGITGGMAPMGITMTTDQNKDQKILLHLDVPSYLWYGSNSYSFATNTDCSQHPCMSVDIFGTISDTDWYGDGGEKGDKAIKTVPKGKRAPKINW
jgi:hypothetical protein